MRVRERQGQPLAASWGKALGFALIACAAAAAVWGDYPLDSDLLASRKPRRLEEIWAQTPQLLAPKGQLFVPPKEFLWKWEGAGVEWAVVVADRRFHTLWRLEGLGGSGLAGDRLPTEVLQPGQTYYWWLEAGDPDLELRAAPIAFVMPQ